MAALSRHAVGETSRQRDRMRRPRPRGVGYWLRRPEPSVALALLSALFFLLLAVVARDWAPLVAALPTGAGGVFVWRTRAVWRYNAEQWRQGYDVF